MKLMVKQSKKRAAFTIVELLTVMSIIIILIGLLVPGLNKVRRYAKLVSQKNQFYSIGKALELFNNEWDGYPPSDAEDDQGAAYCGAMKLAEAMMGQDLLGFHPDSRFRADGSYNGGGKNLYDEGDWSDTEWTDNLKARRGPYLPLEGANAYRLKDLYGSGNTGRFDEELFVLCDIYTRVTNLETGERVGMPILYYKADTAGIKHDPNDLPTTPTDNKGQIYNYLDNDELVLLGMPWRGGTSGPAHPMASSGTTSDGQSADPKKFYESTKNEQITIEAGRPYRVDSYILISAGFDGEYGTPDDVFNFEKK